MRTPLRFGSIALTVALAAMGWAGGLASASPAGCRATSARFSASFVQPALVDGWSDAQLAREQAVLSAACISSSTLQWTLTDNASSKAATFPTTAPLDAYRQSTATDVPGRLLEAAARAGRSVYLGLQWSDDWWAHATDPVWMAHQRDLSLQLADALESRYGHNPAFAGWYLPFEVDNQLFPTPAAYQPLISYYQAVVAHLRSIDPQRPIAVSPFFNVHVTPDPSAWQAMWSEILGKVPIDLVVLQDGVGAQHAAISDLPRWFGAMRAAIRTARPHTLLLADSETYAITPQGTYEPQGIGQVVSAMRAVAPYVSGYWAFSYDYYQSPVVRPTAYADTTYRAYLASGMVDANPPRIAGAATLLDVTAQTVHLSWPSARDNVGVAGYEVYRDGTLLDRIYDPGPSFTDTQLTPGTQYSYAMKAFDAAGNLSALSAATPATTATNDNGALLSSGKPYTASTPASVLYPDTGGRELTDGKRAAQASYSDGAWQGRDGAGSYSVTVDLGSVKTVTSADMDFLQCLSAGVQLPASVTFSTSVDGSSYAVAGSIPRPIVSASDQARTFTLLGLSASARFVRVTVNGATAWSMTDELEAFGH